MDDWDWNAVNVDGGEWWLLLGVLLIAAVALGAGYLFGQDRCRREYEHPIIDNDPLV